MLLKNNSFRSITQGFSKTYLPPLVRGIVKTLSFCVFLSSSLYYPSPITFSNLRSTFFLGKPPSGCFTLYVSECYTQQNQVKSSNNLYCTKNKVFLKDFFSKYDQIRKKLSYKSIKCNINSLQINVYFGAK